MAVDFMTTEALDEFEHDQLSQALWELLNTPPSDE